MLLHLCILLDIRNFGYLTHLFVIILIFTIEKITSREGNKKSNLPLGYFIYYSKIMLLHLCILLDILNFGYLTLLFVILLISLGYFIYYSNTYAYLSLYCFIYYSNTYAILNIKIIICCMNDCR
jgi:hypothetical protein